MPSQRKFPRRLLLIGAFLGLLPGCQDDDGPGPDGTAYSATKRKYKNKVSSTSYDGTTLSGVKGKFVYIVDGHSVTWYSVDGMQPHDAPDRFSVRSGDTIRWLDASGATVATITV